MSKVKREGETGRTAWLLIFITVSVFCIVFFAARGRFVTPFTSPAVITLLAPFQRAAAWAGSQIQGVVANVQDILTVHQQNQLLRSEVEQLRVQNVQANEYAAENIRLRELLGYTQSARQFDLVMARVIGREPTTWTRMIVIDRGTEHGVQKNMAVVTARGLVGTVTDAGPFSSKVQLILDPRAAAGALVQRSRVAGVVKGTPDDAMHPRMVNVPKNQDMAVGDILVTSGFGGIYPKGIMIGTVSAVKNDSGGLLHYAVIEPATDFQRLEDVAVIVASREAPPEPLKPPAQTRGTETDPWAAWAAQQAAQRAAQQAAQQAAQKATQPPAAPAAATPAAQPSQASPQSSETQPAQSSAAESGNASGQSAPAPAQPQAGQQQPVAPAIPAAGGKR
ncbi:MAG: rod shape-determining protein MreC [Schwartzia sp.]|nr:rod shape-determining protein MreC [Schwartzia sp. (in: firmicutes)]